MMISTIQDIKRYAFNSFSGCHGSHDWDHTLRVHRLCVHIGKMEQADMEVLEAAAYLHDVGRPFEEESRGEICHAEKSAAMAEDLLQGYPVSRERRNNILRSIRSHRFRGNHKPASLEAKILFDADKLDAIGAVGIGRAFQFAGEVGARLHNASMDPEDTEPYTENDTCYREYRLKLSKIRDRMLTAEGRRIAEERHEFMETFFERFLHECEGWT